ncbi:hypothetical protein AB0M31_25295 [Streptomyces sp. NPDC051773]|uniref:hypothetical protein n=1 Tax=Streptomyces sp. NPDC051773 TaxID=3156682 RepID=UPI00342AD0AF
MVVDEAVAATLRGAVQTQVAVFVASCAERMGQVFTGLSGSDRSRGSDVELFIQLLGDLWSAETSAARFRDYVASLEGFRELEPSDEEIVDVAGIYSFYSVLVLRYAALYRSGGDVEDALKCAHACLTAMGQLDQNLPGVDFFAQEAEFQQNSASPALSGARDSGPVSRLRERDQAVSRERLKAIQARLRR